MSDKRTKVIATLSTIGYVKDPEQRLDRLMAYYLTSHYSQSTVFRGNIMSLQKQLREYGNDPTELVTRVTDEMTSYLAQEFQGVTVRIRTDIPNKEDPGRINMTVEAVVSAEGRNFSLARVVETRNAVIVNIINLNNEGNQQWTP